MSGMLIQRIFHNSVWLMLALVFSSMFEQMFFSGQISLGMPDALILGAIILSSAFIIDNLSPEEGQQASMLRQSLILILLASAILFFLSHVPNFLTLHAPLALGVMILFALFRFLYFSIAGNIEYPEFLRTRVMLIGSGPAAQKVLELVENSNGKYLLSGVVPLAAEQDFPELGLGEICNDRNERLLALAQKTKTDRLIVAFPERRGVMPVREILRCRMHGLAVIDAPAFYENITRKMFIENLTPSSFIFSTGFHLSAFRRGLKRVLDITGAIAGLIIALPLTPFIILAVKLDSPGPVLFTQTRTGLGGKPFSIIKFRTMCADAEKNGAVWAVQKDPRITRTGAFLRKTRLDEIPQLINVLRGDMSLVGPRPERPEFISELEKAIPFYSERHCVKPGVTGWAQVRYRYGSSIEDALEKLRYDLYYIKNQSVMLDLEIVLKTIGVIFSGSGAR